MIDRLRKALGAQTELAALDRIATEFQEGLRHGHFKMVVTGEIVNSGKRAVVVESGKSYRFLIAETDLQP